MSGSPTSAKRGAVTGSCCSETRVWARRGRETTPCRPPATWAWWSFGRSASPPVRRRCSRSVTRLSSYGGQPPIHELLGESTTPRMTTSPSCGRFCGPMAPSSGDRPRGAVRRTGGAAVRARRASRPLHRRRGSHRRRSRHAGVPRVLPPERRAGSVLVVPTVKLDLVEPPLEDLIDKWEAGGCQVSRVPPLAPEDAASLVSALWRGPPLSQARIASIVATTGGNPFFLDQYIGLRDDDEAVDDEIPDRVEAVLRRRLRRLDEDTRAFLEAAAVALETDGGPRPRQPHRPARRQRRRAPASSGLGRPLPRTRHEWNDRLQPGPPETGRVRQHQRALLACRCTAAPAEWLEAAGVFSSAAHHYGRAERPADWSGLRYRALSAPAEHGGTYQKALELYELAQPFGDLGVIGPRPRRGPTSSSASTRTWRPWWTVCPGTLPRCDSCAQS